MGPLSISILMLLVMNCMIQFMVKLNVIVTLSYDVMLPYV